MGSFFLLFELDADRRDDERLFLIVHPQILIWADVQFVETIVSVVRFRIVPLDQFFASSTFSSKDLVNPLKSCTKAVNASYSPGSSTSANSRSSGDITP